ncbi:MAG TPA: hypothetical protein VFR70_10345, partial [Flavobacterium sp.]|nr:hypothetical protein [Flavobacterium sp.]
SLFIISDNSSVIYEYKIKDQKLEAHPLLEDSPGTQRENIPKKSKPDFEAVADFGGDCYIFGSGSAENRKKMVRFDTGKREKAAAADLAYLYEIMQRFSDIKPEDFNIEGAAYNGESWFLFNRGNGPNARNGIFTVSGANLTDEFSILYNEYKLPKINGVRSSFTDAVIAGSKIYFLAAVENTASTYDDGAVLGTFIGRIDLQKMKIDFTEKISNSHKFEGLALYREDKNSIEFLLCEDKDSDELKSDIFKLALSK